MPDDPGVNRIQGQVPPVEDGGVKDATMGLQEGDYK